MEHSDPHSQLVILRGERRGEAVPIPGQGLLIGRAENSGLVLRGKSVSRRHALISRTAQHTTVITDLGSHNGVWVNGLLVDSATLHHGDQLQLGEVLLRFEDARHPADAPHPQVGPGTPRHGSWSRFLLYAVLINIVGLGANSLVSLLTTWAPSLRWWIGPVIAALAATAGKLLETHRDDSLPGKRPASPRDRAADQPPPTEPDARRRPTQHHRTVTILAASVAVLAAGLAVTAGVSYLVGWQTGNENGVERLVEPVSTTSRGLTLSAHSIQETAHFTRVRLTVRNNTESSITLPLFMNCYLATEDGTSLEADASRSDWGITISPGTSRAGTINFTGHLPPGTHTASLSFATVYGGIGPGSGPDYITLLGLQFTADGPQAMTAMPAPTAVTGHRAGPGAAARGPAHRPVS